MWVRGHTRSLKMAPFDRSHMSSYQLSIVTMAISCIICEDSELLVQNREIFIPHLYLAPPAAGDPVGISWRCLMLIKLEWLGYHLVKKNYDNTLSRFHRIPERNGRTDGQMDRRTDRQTDLLYQYRASVCWRAIKTRKKDGKIENIYKLALIRNRKLSVDKYKSIKIQIKTVISASMYVVYADSSLHRVSPTSWSLAE